MEKSCAAVLRKIIFPKLKAGIFLILLAIVPIVVIAQRKAEITVDRAEAKKAYDLLIDIRTNPRAYYRELQFSRNTRVEKPELQWNETLAKVAEARACDMAKRDYFSHVNPDGYAVNYLINKAGYKLDPEWLEDRRRNSFESIGMGLVGGEEAIKTLIIDEGVPSLGHRKHLLGQNEWNASLKDIGIGYVKRTSGKDWETYICVIIAKHSW